jgi:hypothetical protein
LLHLPRFLKKTLIREGELMIEERTCRRALAQEKILSKRRTKPEL